MKRSSAFTLRLQFIVSILGGNSQKMRLINKIYWRTHTFSRKIYHLNDA